MQGVDGVPAPSIDQVATPRHQPHNLRPVRFEQSDLVARLVVLRQAREFPPKPGAGVVGGEEGRGEDAAIGGHVEHLPVKHRFQRGGEVAAAGVDDGAWFVREDGVVPGLLGGQGSWLVSWSGGVMGMISPGEKVGLIVQSWSTSWEQRKIIYQERLH